MYYLCNTRAIVKDKLFPKDCEKLINRHMAFFQNKLRPKTQRLIRILQRQMMDENGLVPNETPRGQPRMSMTLTNPMAIESEVEQITKFMDELDV